MCWGESARRARERAPPPHPAGVEVNDAEVVAGALQRGPEAVHVQLGQLGEEGRSGRGRRVRSLACGAEAAAAGSDAHAGEGGDAGAGGDACHPARVSRRVGSLLPAVCVGQAAGAPGVMTPDSLRSRFHSCCFTSRFWPRGVSAGAAITQPALLASSHLPDSFPRRSQLGDVAGEGAGRAAGPALRGGLSEAPVSRVPRPRTHGARARRPAAARPGRSRQPAGGQRGPHR